MTTATETKSIQFAVVAALALGAPLEGGSFQGILTLPSGAHELPTRREAIVQRKTWKHLP
jgi:hypothetical protein